LAKIIRVEGVFPLPLLRLWKLLHAHLDDDRIRAIHPRFMSSRTIDQEGAIEFNGQSFPREKLAERDLKIGGRVTRTTWRYWIEPPRRYSYEVKFENGSVTRFDNTYEPTEGGTLVKTVGEISIRAVPSFLAAWFVKRSLNRTDNEDLAFARKMTL
jgi:hypothetical protein